MGIADAFGKEDRVELKISDFMKLSKNALTAEIIMNGLHNRLPHNHIIAMVEGKNDALAEYEETGLTPDQIREIDRLYAEKCKELAECWAERDLLKRQLEELEKEESPEEKETFEIAIISDQEGSNVASEETATQGEEEEKIEAPPIV